LIAIVCSCQFSGSSCGHHGPYTFYRAFTYRDATTEQGVSAWKTLSLGEFFVVRISPGSPPAVGELQLIWETSNGVPGQKLASVKLYFLPEHTPGGRQSSHGQVTARFTISVTSLTTNSFLVLSTIGLRARGRGRLQPPSPQTRAKPLFFGQKPCSSQK